MEKMKGHFVDEDKARKELERLYGTKRTLNFHIEDVLDLADETGYICSFDEAADILNGVVDMYNTSDEFYSHIHEQLKDNCDKLPEGTLRIFEKGTKKKYL